MATLRSRVESVEKNSRKRGDREYGNSLYFDFPVHGIG